MAMPPPEPSLQTDTGSVSLPTADKTGMTGVEEDLSESQSDDEERSFSATPIITVAVGKKQKLYKMHRKLLVERCPFFAKCLDAGMLEQQEHEVVLPEDSCRGFDYIAEWIYFERVKDIDHNDVMPGIKAYILADKYCMSKLQNALVDRLAAYWSRWCVNPSHMGLVADLADKDCPLFKLMIDALAHGLVGSSLYYKQPGLFGSDGEEARLRHADMVKDWPRALDSLLTRPELSTKLLWKVIVTNKATPNPARSPEDYHVATESKSAGTHDTKRKVDEQNTGTKRDEKKARK
ncbi:Transmembrane emp24 domain-containing protein 10 [Elasticomyces elasticus]|uniref:BTB domain-containing protein n=1 Tax=Exophiala sideris TaxID=1016849 RepID=A0ABR0J809_9EURO|nr:Transmembrane emp24 domain-containing protein 10 [Elasticomyces elasticus]KAK5029858.1 hypothetical protein LTS07_005582 [Exophiala sideris]KAK5031703.1 Transmembrane emp24 domain-containing protein 10 [Exophiala sideris]KAK5058381.1 hypothetical protein LTR69_006786 [Exophiala sideris]KAK5180310.1 Transmembrane emp24 domain-containing protein 10 [Eurotiomycetes sp. CCFEE 6388]